MNRPSQQWLFSIARHMVPFRGLALLLSVLRLAPAIFAADANEPAVIEHTQPADPGSQRTSVVRTGVLNTKDALTLRPATDLGSVRIVQLQAGAAPVVRYAVRIRTARRGSPAPQIRSR